MTRPIITAHLGRATLSNSAWYLDRLITFLAIGDDTDGRFALLRVHGIQGAELPAHYHLGEDQTIYLLHGEMTVYAGGEELHACPGDTVTIPRGLEHTVRNDTKEVTFRLQFSPAGFERYFHDMSGPAEYLGLPPNPAPPDHTRMVTTAARYGCVFTGPPR
jgi:quercetin dioxygenase-like cupin family protein